MDVASLEKVLRRTNKTITEEREALARGRWADYLRERVPPPSHFSFRRRRAWQIAYDLARQIGAATEVQSAVIFPLWYCSNQDDVPARDWIQAIAVGFDGSTELYENAWLEGEIAAARLEVARIGFIMPSRFYAPEVKLPYRNRHYVAVESRRIERVVGIDRIASAGSVTKPTRPVAPFATDAESAIALELVEPALATRVRHMTERLCTPVVPQQ